MFLLRDELLFVCGSVFGLSAVLGAGESECWSCRR